MDIVDNKIKTPAAFPFTCGDLLYNDGKIQVLKYRSREEDKEEDYRKGNGWCAAKRLAKDFSKIRPQKNNYYSFDENSPNWCVLPGNTYEEIGWSSLRYLEKGSLYLFVVDGKPAYLASQLTHEFRNTHNKVITDADIDIILPAIEYLVSSGEFKISTWRNFKKIAVRFIDEKTALTSPLLFVEFCLRKKRKRWKEHEVRVLRKSSCEAARYAEKVIQGRAPELEGIISSADRAVFSYCLYLEKQRIPIPDDLSKLRDHLRLRWFHRQQIEYKTQKKSLQDKIKKRANNN